MGPIARRRQRASALVMVLSLMFVLLILVAGMHWRESSARASRLREEANLEARVAAEYQVAKQLHPSFAFSPDSQTVKASLTTSLPLQFPTGLARKLFEDQGIANALSLQPVPKDPRLLARPGKAWNLVSPTSSDPGMQPDKVKMLSIISDDFAYVACAPAGNITAQRVQPWSNELFKPGYSTETAMNGAPARLFAKGNIAVGNLTHGELYLTEGTPSVDKGRFLAFPGPPADLAVPEAYPNVIQGQIHNAMDKLTGADGTQDKTELMNGALLSLEFVKQLFTDPAKGLASALSLRQAMQFPFFFIPGGRIQGIFVTVWLHMPFPPDGAGAQGQLDALQKSQDARSATKRGEYETAKADVKARQDEYNAETDPDKKADRLNKLNDAKKKEESVGKELQELSEAFGDELKDVLDKVPDAETNGPATRTDDEKITGDNGVPYMSYKKFYQVLGQFMVDVVLSVFEAIGGGTPDTSKFMNILRKEVRLVHFGRKDSATEFTISDTHIEMKATFDVPPGRSVRLRSNVKINGDLWLMRGSTLIVEGNLEVANPNAGSSEPRKPRGRVFLEEGAKLIVKGNFTCGGSEALGSVLVGAPINAIHPTTSAIMVTGDITIPHGVWPAYSLGDLDLDKLPELKTFREAVSTVVPNLAKLAGPFHRRKPFFSQYATMFVIACVITPIGPIPIPVPLPAATNTNVNNKLFKAMALIYTTQMNLAWGENFITHADWWLIGEGMVPMFPKVNPTVYLERVKNFHLNSIKFPTPDDTANLIKTQGPEMVKKMAPMLITDVVVKIVIKQLSFGLADFVEQTGLFDLLEKAIADVMGMDSTAGKSLFEVSGLSDFLTEMKSKIADNAALMMLQEVPGCLIYAGGRIGIAEGGMRAPVTIGMLVAQGDIVSNASYTVGAVMSLKGNITANALLFDANTTRCSMFLPGARSEGLKELDWFGWAIEHRYGRLMNVGEPVDIGPTYHYPSLQGWHQ
ncbi:MAG: hypothetical protein KF760_05670 [Candidatus Eremiobacteraeota bacterium]|nr:hypothetical protein [Candidatus Eremiobacteraeota bacterium]MCW5870849.1 hypothetical protein [Candidatus Eremiobacteraeota bacterium]